VGRADLAVALGAQLLAGGVELRLAPGEVLGEGGETRLGVRCFALRAGDPSIVVTILTSWLVLISD
jgi:hypothetical protein